jgi:DNA-binding transcriptional ArsR family regulator
MVIYSAQTLDNVFGALAHSTRREIVTQLSKKDRSVLELAERFAVSQPAITKHLNILEDAGLIARQKQGRYRICHLNANRMDQVSDWVAGTRERWLENFAVLEEYLKEVKSAKEDKENKE